jgi:DNA polymerase-3 subunit delta'
MSAAENVGAAEPPQWLAPALKELLASAATLHHALLIHGPAGIGKSALARSLCAALLCEGPQPDNGSRSLACGECVACGWFAERSHPDFRAIVPEALDPDFVPAKSRKPSREIKIEQVRALGRFMAVGAHRNGWRIVLIEPADAMNHITANALLKTLEEPGSQTLLILVTSQMHRLAPTIRSRCRLVPLSGPDHATALQWLIDAGAPDQASAAWALAAAGSPVNALALVEPAAQTAHQAILEAVSGLPDTSPLRATDDLDRHEPLRWADVLQRWISDLTRVSAGVPPQYFPGHEDRLNQLCRRTTLERLTNLQTGLLDLTARIEHPLNPRMICESTVLAYCQLFETGGRAG